MEMNTDRNEITLIGYSMKLCFPLRNHGVFLHKHSMDEVIKIFEEKTKGIDIEKSHQAKTIVDTIKLARSCGAEDVIDEVVCDKKGSFAILTFSFEFKASMEKFERLVKKTS